MRRVVIFGATSAIARAVAQQLVARGDRLFIVGRNPERLAALAKDLEVLSKRHVDAKVADLNHPEEHARLIQEAAQSMGGIDLAVLAQGVLGNQPSDIHDPKATREVLDTNFTHCALLLTHLADFFEQAGQGHIAAISSVAGDRGRGSNYIYGSAKGALSLFLQGLRNRLAPAGITVTTIKPGFVDTPMTAALKKNPLFAQPDAVACDIIRALDRRQDVVYAPWFWRWIMLVIRSIPERVFKKLKL